MPLKAWYTYCTLVLRLYGIMSSLRFGNLHDHLATVQYYKQFIGCYIIIVIIIDIFKVA